MKRILSLQLVLATSVLSVCLDGNPPTVTIAQGRLEGYVIDSPYGPYIAFQGIRYAKPPVCDLRFKAPVPAEPWSGTFYATKECSQCPQSNPFQGQATGDEDCLCINVYLPYLPKLKKLLPVIFRIPGGAFIINNGSIQNQEPTFMVKKGFIYAIINYRLSALGYMSTLDEACPGNMGMKDQVLALRWIQQNIAAFGGDPKQVTILGQSAGGASVTLHIASPMSKGLFHRAIAQSGASYNGWARIAQEDIVPSAFHLGEVLGCRNRTSQELIDCMRTVDAVAIVEAVRFQIPEKFRYRLIANNFVPITERRIRGEEPFLTEDPACPIERGDYNKVPLLTGVVSAESAIFLRAATPTGYRRPEDVDRNFTKTFKPELRCHRNDPCGDELIARIKSFYFGNEPVSNENVQSLFDMSSDMLFVEGVSTICETLSARGEEPVYLYQFAYEGGLATKDEFGGLAQIPGAFHDSDIAYLFDNGVVAAPGSTDAYIRDTMVELWTNFARTGNPTPDGSCSVTRWLPYTNCLPNYLEINQTISLKTDLYKERLDFWKHLYAYN